MVSALARILTAGYGPGKRFFNPQGPIQAVRLDHEIEHMRILVDVAYAAAGPRLVDNLLQQPTADGAMGGDPERRRPARRASGGGGRPAHAQSAAFTGKRLSLFVAVARPRPDRAPGYDPLRHGRGLIRGRAASAGRQSQDQNRKHAIVHWPRRSSRENPKGQFGECPPDRPRPLAFRSN